MVLMIRMRDGKELRVECEKCELKESNQTGCLTGIKLDGIMGNVIPLYMPAGDIALIWEVLEGENRESEVG
jgi:hypothetical protein